MDQSRDRRAVRSRQLLLDALVSLLAERGFERLTIRNILDRAGVGRATFYAYFEDKDDLLRVSLERLRALLAQPTEGGAPDALAFALPFFEHLRSHRSIYHATIGRESEWSVEAHIQRILRDLARDELQREYPGVGGSRELDLAVRFVVGTLWAFVVWWIGECPDMPPVEVDALFQRVTRPGLEALLAKSPSLARG